MADGICYTVREEINRQEEQRMVYARDFRNAAKKTLESYWLPSIGAVLLYGLLYGAVSSTFVGLIIAGGPLAYGYYSYWLERVRWQRPDIGTLFKGFTEQFGTSIAAWLLQGLFTVLWGLLFVVPGIIKGYSYALTMFILKDYPTLDALEAIDLSRDMMDGNKWRLFCLDLSFIGWRLLCVVTLGIASLYVAPYYQAAVAQFYETVKAEYEITHPTAA